MNVYKLFMYWMYNVIRCILCGLLVCFVYVNGFFNCSYFVIKYYL